MDIEKIKQNKLKMILGFSIPSIIAMLLETVITMTDGYFTGNYVSESALAAINLGLPILYLYLGLGLCVGVGGSVICGRLIGAKDKKKASETLSQTVVTSIVFCVAVSVIVFALFGPIQGFLKAEGELAGYFKDYYMVMLFNYPVMVVATVLGMFIRMDGRPGICMAISIAGCILNVILDYIFVAALGMGVFGSAVGSLIVQLVTAVTMAVYFLRRCAGIHFTGYKFDKNLHKDMIFNGSSEFIGEMASAISMYAFNYVLIKYAGAEGVAAYTIMGYVVYAFSMICIGFGQGITPLVSVCFGAKEYETAAHLRKITNVILFVIGAALTVFIVLMGKRIAGLFGCSESVQNMAQTGFRIYSVTLLVMGYDVVNSMYFTSCGDAKSSALISMLRGIVLLLGFTLLLPLIFGVNGIWLAAPCTEVITALVSMYLINRQRLLIEKGQAEWKIGEALQLEEMS
jgi:putative MATE family efflux protein